MMKKMMMNILEMKNNKDNLNIIAEMQLYLGLFLYLKKLQIIKILQKIWLKINVRNDKI